MKKAGSEKKKILVIIPRFFPIVGGSEMFIFRLSKMLMERGSRVMILTARFLPDSAETEIIDGVIVSRVGIAGGQRSIDWITSIPISIVKERKNFRSMLIVGVDFHDIFAALTGKFFRKKIIIRPATGREDFSFNSPALSLFSSRNLYRLVFRTSKWLMLKLLLLLTDRWIAISGEIEEEMIRTGIPADKISLLPNGIETDIFRPVDRLTKKRLRQTLSIPANAMVLMFCGRLVKRKGVDLLLRVFGELARSNPELHLLLVGSGAHQTDSVEDEVMKYRKMEFLGKKITWIADDRDMPKYYQASDIFILPSEREGMPNALLEAMASGIPCIASSIGGVTDIIKDSSNGLLFKDYEGLRDAIISLSKNRELRENMSLLARNTVIESYDLKKISSEYLNIFK